MSHLHGPLIRELAHVLTVALGSVLGQAHSPQAVRSAIDTAQVLGLGGLERLLNALLPHALHPWPTAAAPALERVRALAAECLAVASIVPIQRADAELSTMAESLTSLSGEIASGEAVPGEVPTLNLAEVLEDLPLADDASRAHARRVRVDAPVAAALRAALDWLEEEGSPRPLRLSAEESMVDVISSQVNYAGLRAAEKVLSVVGGVIFPASVLGSTVAPAGSWIVRVPSVSGRNSHLMLVQGGIPLALPWHAVLRLYMVPSVEIEAGMTGLGFPVLAPIKPLAKARGEHPVVLVGHGLKRAYLVADQLVWRLEAEPCTVDEAPPALALTRAVETEDGEIYWVLEPGLALAPIEPPPLAPVSRARGASPADLPVLRRDEVEPLEAPAPARDREAVALEVPLAEAALESAAAEVTAADPLEAVAGEAGPAPTDATLTETDAPARAVPEATAEPVVREAPAAPAERAPQAPPVTPPIAPVPSLKAVPRLPERREPPPLVPHRALIAEDSIAARVFLTRMLEREGFTVRAVTTATELFDELVDDGWSLVCVDVELPDGREEDVIQGVLLGLGERAAATPVVALVRDAADVAVARAAGVTRTLKKPFDRESLLGLLSLLGLSTRNQP